MRSAPKACTKGSSSASRSLVKKMKGIVVRISWVLTALHSKTPSMTGMSTSDRIPSTCSVSKKAKASSP